MDDENIIKADSDKLDSAISAISTGDLAEAKRLLFSVIKNAPKEYSHQSTTEEGGLIIRFWDQAEFLQYVTWRKPTQDIICKVSVYPRAFFHLGFIGVAERDYESAIGYLDQAAALEPTNPKIALEKAQALMALKRSSEALKLFEQVSNVGPYTSEADVARGLRGKGFVLIEMGRMAEAEDVLNASLRLDPDSDLAKSELGYIAQLKSGGAKAPGEMKVTLSGKNIELCDVCGKKFERGSVGVVMGRSGVICDSCNKKSTKKPWQFWK